MKLNTRAIIAGLTIVSALVLAGCPRPVSEIEQTTANVCKDPHNTGGGGGVQPCVRQSDCQVCGTGWQCWVNGDTNCHTHAPGTPWSGPP